MPPVGRIHRAMRSRIFILATLLILLGGSATAHACPGCSVGPLRCVPGFWLLSLESGAAMLVLSAFLERPFVAWAGVKRNALAHSIVATGVTVLPMLVGAWTLLIVGFSARSEFLMLMWVPGSIVISAAIKYAWLNRSRSIWHGTLKAWPIVLGAIASGVTVALLPLIQMPFGFGEHAHAVRVEPIRPWAALVSIAASLCVLFIARTYAREDLLERIERSQPRGFEVVPSPTTPSSTSNT